MAARQNQSWEAIGFRAVMLALAVLALLVHYAHVSVPIISASHVFDVLAIGYLVLMIGVLFRGV